jgi:hypothetical protein
MSLTLSLANGQRKRFVNHDTFDWHSENFVNLEPCVEIAHSQYPHSMATLSRTCGALMASLSATRRAMMSTATTFQCPSIYSLNVSSALLSRSFSTQAPRPRKIFGSTLQQAQPLIARPMDTRSHAASFHVSAVCHKQVFVGTVVSDKPEKTGQLCAARALVGSPAFVLPRYLLSCCSRSELICWLVSNSIVL